MLALEFVVADASLGPGPARGDVAGALPYPLRWLDSHELYLWLVVCVSAAFSLPGLGGAFPWRHFARARDSCKHFRRSILRFLQNMRRHVR